MLKVSGLGASYGNLQVLWDVSLKVENGEIVALLGPNGAGKTTLLKSILGIVPLVSGSLKFDGIPINGLPTANRVELGISLVPEGRGIFPYMTVRENLELGAISKRSRFSKEKNFKRCFELFPILKERENQMAGTLSGGEMQMLAIARGLMSEPKLLMIDEASLGLAPLIVNKIFQVLKEVNKQGVTILLVEQNVFQALEISNRAYVLENGRIVLEGPSVNLKSHAHVKRVYLGI
ncbi:MAG: ABC transporter ATP-binding protein [Nitrososphaerales archaeon]